MESEATTSIYPWYGEVDDDSLEQGDLLADFPLLVLAPPYEENALVPGSEPPVSVRRNGIIVLTQSCDLDAKKVENVLVCPYFPFPMIAESFQELRSDGGKEKLRQGRYIALHLLPPCTLPGREQEHIVVNFRQLATAPFELLAAIARSREDRIRLLPPYREHLAQAFAQFIGRVGLPTGYPRP